MSSSAKQNALFVGSAAKAFDIFEAFDPQTPSLSLTEIMRRTGLNKSATQRYLFTLETLGYLGKDASSKRYSLALKTLFPASNYLSQNPLISAAYPHIVQLRQQLDARIGLSARYDDQVVYLIPLQSIREAYQSDYPGFRVPIYCTTSGRIFLSYETDDEARRVLSSSKRESHTPFTKTDIDEILSEIQLVRQKGYSLTNQEIRLGHLNLGVPVLGSNRRLVACIVAVVQTNDWDTQRLQREAWPQLHEAAERILVPPRTGT